MDKLLFVIDFTGSFVPHSEVVKKVIMECGSPKETSCVCYGVLGCVAGLRVCTTGGISEMQPGGGIELRSVMRRKEVMESKAKNIIVISDGQDSDGDWVKPMAETLRQSGRKVSSIVIRNRMDKDLHLLDFAVEKLSKATGGSSTRISPNYIFKAALLQDVNWLIQNKNSTTKHILKVALATIVAVSAVFIARDFLQKRDM